MIAFKLSGAPEVQASLMASYARIFVAVQKAMQAQMGQLATYVQSQKLHGQVLHQRTGNLARSVVPDVQTQGGQVQGTVGIPEDNTVPYGAFWELGFQGTETVREHLRRTRSGGTSVVREHMRQVSQAPRSFLVSAYNDRVEAIAAALTATVDRAVQNEQVN